MQTQPIRPAHIVFDDAGLPLAPGFGDRYHPAAGALAQARHVFLEGNALPERWRGREHFTVLELGFGLGLNFLATWQAWRDDPQRPRWLHYVGLDLHPPSLADLARAHATALPAALQPSAAALRAGWPPATPNLHALDLDEGRVQLLLGWGDAGALLPVLRLQADAIFLDGFAPGRGTGRNAAIWSPRTLQALARRTAAGATAATWCAARPLRDALAAVGFLVQPAPGLGSKREITLARFAPRYTPPPLPDGQPQAAPGPTAAAPATASAAPLTVPHGAPHAAQRPPARNSASESAPALAAVRGPTPGREALVVGGGIAGACTAQALARLGWDVTVLDRHAEPAAEASGNAAGLFHGTVNPDDGPYARLFRAAALHAMHAVRAAQAAGVPASTEGLLRLETAGDDAAQALLRMRAVVQRLALPPDWVQALPAAEASALAGVPLPGPAWLYPGGGWVAPRPWVRHLLATPGVRWRGGVEVLSLARTDDGWQVRDAQGRCIAAAPLLVLAGGAAGPALLAPWRAEWSALGPSGDSSGGPWPLRCTRGQITGWAGASGLRMAVAGDGYALPVPGTATAAGAADGRSPAQTTLWCGATRQPVALGTAADLSVHADEHAHNLARVQRLTGLRPPQGTPLLGRAGLRLHADDRLPLAGPVPDPTQPLTRPRAALAARLPGLFVLGALGARGLTLAPLLARLVASQATGTPWPLEQDLVDAVDPVRWRVRALRQAGSAR